MKGIDPLRGEDVVITNAYCVTSDMTAEYLLKHQSHETTLALREVILTALEVYKL